MTDVFAPAPLWRGGFWNGVPAYVRLAVVYFLAYLALNVVKNPRALDGTPITLWSPDDALSVILIMESWTFAPVLLVAQVASDKLLDHVGNSLANDALIELSLTLGHCAIALTLRQRFGFNVRAMQPRDLIALTAVVPVGLAIVGLPYCGALVAFGGAPHASFLACYAGFWIGDAAAMCIIIPATGAVFRVVMSESWRESDFGYSVVAVMATLALVVGVVVISALDAQTRYLFNLLYLPILLIGMRFGYDAGALALMLVQFALLGALQYFHVSDREFAVYQFLMFILAISGQALGAAFTEREAATELLRRQQADLAKVSERATNGAIAAAMSHEISQPLASIAAYMFGARRLLETGPDVEKALGALRKGEEQAARARRIVERLRDFVAKGDLMRERVDLSELAATILKLHFDAARERGVALLRGPGASGPLPAFVDRVGVEQALANLVLNAIEAAPAGRGVVTVTLERRGDGWAFVVEDNGAGVAPEIADRLFEPFETTKPRGMGLGLPLAREIAVRHGGALTYRPAEPQGARFELAAPFA